MGERAIESGLRSVRVVGATLRLALACTFALAIVSACTRAPVREQSFAAAVTVDAASRASAVLYRALGLIGTPYRARGTTPESGFDCSGLVGFVFADAAGLMLPRSSAAQRRIDAPDVPQDALAPSDLVFFARGGRISHVGIYVGDGRFVHAPSTGGSVRLDRLDDEYWQEHYAGAKRALALAR